MAFVNEYVSDEDVKKYDLEGLYNKWSKFIPSNFRYNWTVDRERDSHFIRIRTGYGSEPSLSNHVLGVLYYQGIHWKVEIRAEEGGSIPYSEHPYRRIWGLEWIKHPEGGAVPEAELIPILKEALIAYKVWGIDTPVTDVVTTFTF